MTGRPWYAHYLADYDRDTADLSLMEHGAYRKLLDHYYRTGGPLPANALQLHRACGAFKGVEKRVLNSILDRFFDLVNGFYHHKRCDAELAKSAEISQKRAAAAMQMHKSRDAIAEQKHTQSQSHTQREKKEGETAVSQARPPKPQSKRWDAGKTVPREWINEADEIRRAVNKPPVDAQAEALAFVDHWVSVGEARADWHATWRNWIRRSNAPAVRAAQGDLIKDPTGRMVARMGPA
jgi:uncharacterized protein YdaU (DUF1376 family)